MRSPTITLTFCMSEMCGGPGRFVEIETPAGFRVPVTGERVDAGDSIEGYVQEVHWDMSDETDIRAQITLRWRQPT